MRYGTTYAASLGLRADRGPGRYILSGPMYICRGGWMDCRTMNPPPPTDRQYIYFNRVFPYKPVLMQPILARYLRSRYSRYTWSLGVNCSVPVRMLGT